MKPFAIDEQLLRRYLATNVATRRAALRLTIAQASGLLVDPVLWGQVEAAQRDVDLYTLVAIALQLDVDPVELLREPKAGAA